MKPQVSFRLLQGTRSPNQSSSRNGNSVTKFASANRDQGKYAKKLAEMTMDENVAFKNKDANLIDSRLIIIESVQQLEGIRKQNGRIQVKTLRQILSLLEHLVVPNSIYKDLMAWMLRCLEEFIFVTADDKHEMSNLIHEMRFRELSNKELSYRGLASLFKDQLESYKNNSLKDTLVKGRQRQGHSDDSETPINLPPVIYDKESSMSSNQNSPRLVHRGGQFRKALTKLQSPEFLMTPIKPSNNLLLTSPDCELHSSPKSHRENISSYPSIMRIRDNEDNSNPASSVRIEEEENDRKELKERAQSLYALNSKLTSEIGRLINENTSLKNQYADYRLTNTRDHASTVDKIMADNQSLHDRLNAINEENSVFQQRCKKLENAIVELKSHVANLVHVSSTASEKLNRLLSGREEIGGVRMIMEPSISKIIGKLGFCDLDFEFSGEEPFVEKIEKIFKMTLKSKQKPQKMATRQDGPPLENRLSVKKNLSPSHSSVGLNSKFTRKGSFNTLTLRSPSKQFTSKDTGQSNLHPQNTFKTFRNTTTAYRGTILEQDANDASNDGGDRDACVVDGLVRDMTGGLMPAIECVVNAVNKL